MSLFVAGNDCQTCIRGPAERCAKMVACIDKNGTHTMYIEVSPVDLTNVPVGPGRAGYKSEERMDIIGQNGNDGLHYKEDTKHPNQAKTSDGSTANYYELPAGATQLQDLISAKDMNAQMGEIFRACYRYGQVSHSPRLRDIKKIIFYAQAELNRLEKCEGN